MAALLLLASAADDAPPEARDAPPPPALLMYLAEFDDDPVDVDAALPPDGAQRDERAPQADTEPDDDDAPR